MEGAEAGSAVKWLPDKRDDDCSLPATTTAAVVVEVATVDVVGVVLVVMVAVVIVMLAKRTEFTRLFARSKMPLCVVHAQNSFFLTTQVFLPADLVNRTNMMNVVATLHELAAVVGSRRDGASTDSTYGGGGRSLNDR